MASDELGTVIQMLKARLEARGATLDDDRRAMEEMLSSFRIDPDVKTERVGVGGVPAEWIVAPEADTGLVLLYLHGGGYVVGSVRSHRVMMSYISRASGARVLGLDYRLSPESPFPAPVEDTVAAYRWLLSSGVEPGDIVIGGDSAGGGLTVSALVALRYLGEPMPAAAVLISPWTDMETSGDSFTTNAEADPSVTRDRILDFARTYMAGKDPRAPLASPIYADLTGLPPLLVQVGSVETLLDDSTVLAKRAKAAGVKVELDVWDDMPHVWHLFAPILPEARQAIKRLGTFVKNHTV